MNKRIFFLVSALAPFVSLQLKTAMAEFCPKTIMTLSTSDAPSGDAPFAIRACDINKDGRLDLFTANDSTDTLSILINIGSGTFAPKVRWPVDTDGGAVSEPVDVACCDVNGDGFVDLVSVNHTSDDVSVLLNLGNSMFATAVKYSVGEAPFGIECLDLDGDEDMDLVTSGFTADAISVLLNNGLAVFAPHVPYATGDAPIAMALCDLDGDTELDVVTANMLGKSISRMRNNGDGSFTNLGAASLCRTPQNCINPFDIVCCDIDGVNGPDVATANGIDDSLAVLFNNGSGSLGGLTFYDNIDGAYGLSCCDLNGDTQRDITTANLASDDLTVFINLGTGSFGAPLSVSAGGSRADPSSVVCSDMDADLDNDLATSFIDGVGFIENDCGGPEPEPVPAASEWALVSLVLLILISGSLLLSRYHREVKQPI